MDYAGQFPETPCIIHNPVVSGFGLDNAGHVTGRTHNRRSIRFLPDSKWAGGRTRHDAAFKPARCSGADRIVFYHTVTKKKRMWALSRVGLSTERLERDRIWVLPLPVWDRPIPLYHICSQKMIPCQGELHRERHAYYFHATSDEELHRREGPRGAV